jgi:hypothetical protein
MKQANDLSSEASKLLETARDVPALDSERRERMKRAVLAMAPPDPSGPDSATIGSPVAGRVASALRFPKLSVVVVVVSALVAAVSLPWALSGGEGGDDLASSTTSPARTTALAVSPEPSVSAGDLPSPIADAPAAEPAVPSVPFPDALGAAKPAKPEGRRGMASGAAMPKPTTAAEPVRPIVGSPSTGDGASGAVRSASAASPSENAPTAPVESAATSSLQEEVRLVRSADAAVSARDPSRALSLLSEHERRFPRGTLASERAMLVVLALCAAGRNAEASAQAERFKERYPHSPLQERLQHSCAGGGRP